MCSGGGIVVRRVELSGLNDLLPSVGYGGRANEDRLGTRLHFIFYVDARSEATLIF